MKTILQYLLGLLMVANIYATTVYYSIESVDEQAECSVAVYESTMVRKPTTSVQARNLEIWAERPEKGTPSSSLFRDLETVEKILVSSGWARIKDQAVASEKLVAAQKSAEANGRGMWKEAYDERVRLENAVKQEKQLERKQKEEEDRLAEAKRKQEALDQQLKAREDAEALAEQVQLRERELTEKIENLEATGSILTVGQMGLGIAKQLIDWVWRFIGWFGGAFAVLTCALGVVRFRARSRVKIVYFGGSQVGKTWLWTKLKDPKATRLPKEVTQHMNAGKFPDFHANGNVYKANSIDIGANETEEQVRQIMIKKNFVNFLVPPRLVILLCLAPTSSEEEATIDQEFVREQLGALKFILALMFSRAFVRPRGIFVVLTKCDLFGRAQLESVFGSHISLVNDAARKSKIDFEVFHVSSINNTGLSDLRIGINDLAFR